MLFLSVLSAVLCVNVKNQELLHVQTREKAVSTWCFGATAVTLDGESALSAQ